MISLAVLLAALRIPAAAAEPGDSAIAFLKVLGKDESAAEELLKKTFISPHVGTTKRGVIGKRLSRLGRHLQQGEYDLKVIAVKQDEELAGVLVSAVSKFDPLEVEVLGVALGKADEKWKVAPIPASFENSAIGFSDAVESRAEALELWMGRERVLRLRDLQIEVEQQFRDRMAKAVPDALLEKANPKQVVEAFLEAVRGRNLPAAMVLLGRFGEAPTEEDREVHRVVSLGLKGLDRRNHWRLLTSPDVVRVVVMEDAADDLDAEVVVLLLDPADSAGTNILRFILLRSGKRWDVELPTSLRLADAERLRFQRAIWRERDSDDAELRKQFPLFFEKAREPLRGKDLQTAGKEIEKILREGSLDEFLRYLHRSDDLTDGERRVAYAELGQFWSTFHEGAKAAADGELVEVLAHDDAGVLVFHVVSTAQLDRLKLKPLVMLKGDDGWAIAPGVTTAGNYEALADARRASQNEAIGNFIDQRADLSKKAADRFLQRFAAAVPKKGIKADPEAAGRVVREFRNLLREGRLLEAFERCALLDASEGAWEALKSLSYEYRGARQATQPDRQVGVQAAGQWAAVSLRVDSGPTSMPDYPMYLVVESEAGPRIVVDVGLRLATNKGREVLNKRVWARIGEQLDEEETGLVRNLFGDHVTRCRKDLEEWEKNNKSSP